MVVWRRTDERRWHANATQCLLNDFFLPARHLALFSARLLVLINAGGQLGSGDQKGFVYNEASWSEAAATTNRTLQL